VTNEMISVLVEFIADLFPNAGIFPADPVQRAQARFFIDQVNTKFTSKFYAYTVQGEPAADLLAGVDALQALLPADKKFALGNELSAADIALAPFLLRGEVAWGLRDRESVWTTLQGEKYSRFWKYYQDLKAHPSIAGTFDEVCAAVAGSLTILIAKIRRHMSSLHSASALASRNELTPMYTVSGLSTTT
jgi:glutathione S-transferase